jgi:hypothetical protein
VQHLLLLHQLLQSHTAACQQQLVAPADLPIALLLLLLLLLQWLTSLLLLLLLRAVLLFQQP